MAVMLEAAAGKRTVQLAIVPDAATVPNPNGVNQHTAEVTATELHQPDMNHETARRLRAINRAPEGVREAR